MREKARERERAMTASKKVRERENERVTKRDREA